jgi:hypothetical protein
MKLLPVAVAAISLPLAAGAAMIVPVSQTRTVTASARVTGGPLVTSSFSAADFSPWDETAGAESVHPTGPGWYYRTGVSQTSTLGEDRLSAHLQVSFGTSFSGPGGTGSAVSLFDVTFDLLESANYQLGNGLEPFLFGSGLHVVRLRNESGQVIAQPLPGYYYPPGSDDLLAWTSVVSGVLPAGRYRLTSEWSGYPLDPGSLNAAAVLLFTPIPEPGSALLVALGLGALAARKKSRRPNRLLLLPTLLGVAAMSAFAPLAAGAAMIVPVSQTRSVSASAQVTGGPLVSSSFSASDFAVFDQSAGAYSQHPAGPAWYVSNGVGQESTIGEDRLTAHLEASFGWGTPGPGGTASTQSLFDVSFDLLESANYQLGNGMVNRFGIFPSATHTVTLRNESGQVIAQPGAGYYFPTGSDDLLAWTSVVSGILPAGRYRLTAQWNNGFAPDPDIWNAAAVLLFTPIPEPGSALLVALGLGALAARRHRAES